MLKMESDSASGKPFKTLFFGFTDRADFWWAITGAQIAANTAPPDR
jgi:hypothetical protein